MRELRLIIMLYWLALVVVAGFAIYYYVNDVDHWTIGIAIGSCIAFAAFKIWEMIND